jgi:hypothetical protein
MAYPSYRNFSGSKWPGGGPKLAMSVSAGPGMGHFDQIDDSSNQMVKFEAKKTIIVSNSSCT